jgi:hypothetical protein
MQILGYLYRFIGNLCGIFACQYICMTLHCMNIANTQKMRTLSESCFCNFCLNFSVKEPFFKIVIAVLYILLAAKCMLCSNEQGEVLCPMELGGSCMISCVNEM